MLQDIVGNFRQNAGKANVLLTSGAVVGAWGYFLYMGTIDPLGGINSLWPLFGIANQMLAAIALCVGTTILVKSGKLKYSWVTAVPLSWLIIVTSSAAWQKLFADDLRVGFLAHANDLSQKLANGSLSADLASKAPSLIFNDYLNAGLTSMFMLITWLLVADTLRVIYCIIAGKSYPQSSEAEHIPSRLVEDWVRD
jgi:carbon starvation protein